MWVPFEDLPLDSRIWVFQSDRLLNFVENKEIDLKLKSFLEKWYTHGQEMHTSHKLIYNCFVILAANETHQVASGCSIDSFTTLFKDFGHLYKLSFFDRFSIAFEYDNIVKILSLEEFKTRINSGLFPKDIIVFNNLVSSISDLRCCWKIPIKESWLKGYL